MMRRNLGVRVTVGVGALDPTNDSLPESGRRAAIALQLAVHQKTPLVAYDDMPGEWRGSTVAETPAGHVQRRWILRAGCSPDRCTPGRLRARGAVGMGELTGSVRTHFEYAIDSLLGALRSHRGIDESALSICAGGCAVRWPRPPEPRLGRRARRCAQGAGPRRQRAGAKPAEAEAGTSGALHRRALRGSAHPGTSRAAGRTLEKLLLQQLCRGGRERLCGLPQECSRGASEAPAPVLDFTHLTNRTAVGIRLGSAFNRAFKSAVG